MHLVSRGHHGLPYENENRVDGLVLDYLAEKCVSFVRYLILKDVAKTADFGPLLDGRQGYLDAITESIDAYGGGPADGIDCRVHIRKPY